MIQAHGAAACDVAIDFIQILYRQQQLVAALVEQGYELLAVPHHLDELEPVKFSDTVILVHDKIAHA